jgi:hypothetical protein
MIIRWAPGRCTRIGGCLKDNVSRDTRCMCDDWREQQEKDDAATKKKHLRDVAILNQHARQTGRK